MRNGNRKRLRLVSFVMVSGLLIGTAATAQQIPPPEKVIGKKVGTDRFLAPWPKVVEYFRALGEASGRVSVELAGKSTLDNEMILVILSSEENQKNLDHYRSIARQLANPDNLSEESAQKLIDEGKAIALITGTIHSTEVASTQMFMEFVYKMATSNDPEVAQWLDEVILLIFPSINPDGQVMVIDWYNKHLGTEYEGGRMPWLYQHYVGHDNNRDFYMLTQKETQVVNSVLYHRWFPQVFLDEHQMGSTGPRLFVPPQTDPLSLKVDSMVFRLADSIGTHMGLRLEQAGKTGVGHNMIYDSYWPGGTRNTAWWKNVVGLLTEAASARIATPIYIEPNELSGGRKGFPEYGRRANFPSPWPGGWWRLRDIVDYELVATEAYLEANARHSKDILANFYTLSRQGIEKGRTEGPSAFLIPPDQHDPVVASRLVEILLMGGVRVHVATKEIEVKNTRYPEGTYVILTSQPYRAFVLEMLTPQRYPEVRASADSDIFPPYDVTAWSLPISLGVETVAVEGPISDGLRRINAPLWPGGEVKRGRGGYRIPHSADTAYTAMNRLLERGKKLYWLKQAHEGGRIGDIYLPEDQADSDDLTALSKAVRVPIIPLDTPPRGDALEVAKTRVGLYKPWAASMDEGWTRWLLERYDFSYQNLSNKQIKDGSFRTETDALILPDVSQTVIRDGQSPRDAGSSTPFPPEYQGGLGTEGGKHLKEWVEEGGTLVALDSSTAYAIDLFKLPVTNVLNGVSRTEFNAPGSMLRMYFDTSHPLAYGMRREEAGYFSNSPAFQTRLPRTGVDRRVVATYPLHDDQILVSGYIRGAERLENKTAAVEFKVGKGRVVLIGFRAQHRAQPHRTFKLLFNALYLSGLKDSSL